MAIAPLPGVTIPAGPREPLDTGGGAVRWVLGHWSELEPSQQAAVRAALPLPAGLRTAGARGLRTLACTAPAGGDSPGVGQYRSLVNQALVDLALHLGPLTSPTFVVLGTAPEATGALAAAVPLDCDGGGVGPEASCTIYVDNARGRGGAELRATVTHEVFHCYQAQMAGSLSAYVNVKTAAPWVVEGMAEWVGEEVAGGSAVSAKWWHDYLTKPGLSLFARSYDAIGFYAHVKESGVDPWARFRWMLTAGSSAAAYGQAAFPAGTSFLDSWAAGYARQASWGQGWDTSGPGITGERPAIQRLVIGNNGGGLQPSASAYTNYVGEFDLQADVVLVEVSGHGRLHTSGGQTIAATGALSGAYCTLRDGCECPPGSQYVGPPLSAIPPGATFLALTGGPDGASASLDGGPMAGLCHKPPSPSPSASPTATGGSCGTYVLAGEAPTQLASERRLTSQAFGGETETLCQYFYGNLAVIVFSSRAGAQSGYQEAVHQCDNIGGASSQPGLGAEASFETVGKSSADATPSVCAVALKGSTVVAADYNQEHVTAGQVNSLMRLAVSRT